MRRVLLVDDARLFVELQGTTLSRAAIERHVVPAGHDWRPVARSFRPDLIVVDDGEFPPEAFEWIREYRGSAGHAAVIVLVGNPLSRAAALEAGADGFVPRPVARWLLAETLAGLGCGALRRAARRGVDLGVTLELAAEFDLRPLTGRCSDLSVGGARLQLNRPAAARARGSLRFSELEGLAPLPVEVVHGGTSAGVMFLLDGFVARAELARLVRRAGERRRVAIEAAARDAR